MTIMYHQLNYWIIVLCRELEEYKEKQDDNQNGGDVAKISSKHVCSFLPLFSRILTWTRSTHYEGTSQLKILLCLWTLSGQISHGHGRALLSSRWEKKSEYENIVSLSCFHSFILRFSIFKCSWCCKREVYLKHWAPACPCRHARSWLSLRFMIVDMATPEWGSLASWRLISQDSFETLRFSLAKRVRASGITPAF